MGKHVPLPSDPQERKKEINRRHKKHKADAKNLDYIETYRANLDLIGLSAPPLRRKRKV